MSEENLVRQCAPTLAGIKTGTIFPAPFTSLAELTAEIRKLNRILVPKGLRLLPLRYQDHTALLYLYRPAELRVDLKDQLAEALLADAGYSGKSSEQCVAYLAKPDGSIDLSRNFNRMLVDAGQACLWDFSNNEFDPASWWNGQIPGSVCVKGDSGSTTSSAALFTTPYSSSSGSSSAGGMFVGSVKSNKYHYPSCEWGQKISPANEIWFSSSADARAHGYVPCKVCCPP